MTPEEKELFEMQWRYSCILWATDNKIKTEKGQEIELKNHRFLKDIYDDLTPIQSVRKSGQIGFSTMMILKSLWMSRYQNFQIIYTLPTFKMASDFVSAKVNPIISHNPLLTSWTKDKDSVFQKRIGNGFINYRGASSTEIQGKEMESGSGIMLSADVLIMDESDRSSQAILEQYESRLSASSYKGKWYFSNPTTPHTLTQQLYEQSDQKHWFVKCDNGHWQYLDFWKNIKDYKFVCEKCGIEITDENRRQGQWIKKYQNREISGYWLPHLICPWITAKQIQETYENKSKQYFYNFVLGLPYIGSDVVVNKDIILRNIDLSEPNFQQNNVLGVDQGFQKHWVLGNKQGIFACGMTEDWQDIEELIRVYDVETAVFDALPDLTEPRKIRDKYPGKVWLNYYKKDIRKADFIFWDYKTHTVYSDRTKIFQQVIDDLVNRKIRFQMKAQELGEYIRQWQTLFKTTEKDSLGIERDVWKSQGDDHYCHATNYFRLALEKTGEGEIKEWQKEEKIYSELTPSIEKMIRENEQYET